MARYIVKPGKSAHDPYDIIDTTTGKVLASKAYPADAADIVRAMNVMEGLGQEQSGEEEEAQPCQP